MVSSSSFTPFLLRRLLSPDHPLATWLVLLFGLSISGLVWLLATQQMAAYHRTEFEWVAQNRNRIFQKGMSSAIDAIAVASHFVSEMPAMDEPRFRRFSHHLMDQHPWLSSLTWWPEAGDLITVGMEEQEYYNIPFLQESIASSRTTHRMTARIDASQNGGDVDLKSVIVVPVLATRSAVADSAQKELLGLLVGRINLSQLANLSISILEPRGVEFLLLDETDPAAPQFLDFYTSRLSDTSPGTVTAGNWQQWRSQQHLLLTEHFPVADRSWSITCAATPQFRSAEGFAGAPFAVLVGGLLLTLTTTYFLNGTRRSLIERTRLYMERERSEETLRVFFEQCPDIVLIVDRNSMVRAVNRDLPLLDQERQAPLLQEGSCFLDVLPGDLLDVYQTVFKTVLLTGQPNQFSHQSGKSMWWEVRIAPIRRRNTLIEAMVLFTNVSERRFLELKALRNARLASMGFLAAGVAHEINNPNNAIHFNASLLKRGWQDALPILRAHQQTAGDFALGGVSFERAVEAIPRLIDGISHSADRISSIVASLKELTRNEAGSMAHFVNVADVVRAALLLLDHQIKKYTDFLTFQLDSSGAPDGLLLVWGNFQQLEQVVINLVMNALFALPDRSKSIQVRADMLDGEVRILVEDEGCGMDDQVQSYVFDPFFTTRSDKGGTGLGLSLVQEIVTNHGGRIQLHSKPKEGTRMTVLLPLDTKQTGRPAQVAHSYRLSTQED
ncbi:MAG: PAS domain-containing protein [Magnetococcales bacterium]|nr:PAS domain-containing protein [Magnetococcales bacterium]